MLSAEDKLKKMMKKLPQDLQDNLKDIRNSVEQIWSTDRVIPDFTNHGIDHSLRVIGYAYDILESNNDKNKELDEIEMYLLLASIYLHDIGMQCYPPKPIFLKILEFAKYIAKEKNISFNVIDFKSQSCASLTFDEKDFIREYHSLLTKAMIDFCVKEKDYEILRQACRGIPQDLAKDLSDICFYHSRYSIMKCSEYLFNSQGKGRKRLIAAILRLADEMDISRDRVNKNDIEILSRSPESIFYWLKHMLTSVTVKNNVIYLTVFLNPEDAKNYGHLLQASIINHFCCKNKELIGILNDEKFEIKLDDDKKRKDGIPKIDTYISIEKIPDNILDKFRLLERENEHFSNFRYRYKIGEFSQDMTKDVLKNKSPIRILVIGDVMIDHVMYMLDAPYSRVLRHDIDEVSVLLTKNDPQYKRSKISSSERRTLGGAAGIVKALLSIPNVYVDMISVIGEDLEGNAIKELFEDLKNNTKKNEKVRLNFYPVEINEYPTVTKYYYYIVRFAQGLEKKSYRFDREDIYIINEKIEEYKNKIKKLLDNIGSVYDCIIIKDHEKGTINKDIVDWISKKYPHSDIYVDPKYNFDLYADLDIKAIIPNIKEASMGIREIANLREQEVEIRAGDSDMADTDFKYLNESLPNCDSFIVKADRNGAIIYSSSENDNGFSIKNNDSSENDKIYYRDQIYSYPIDKLKEKNNIGCGDIFDAYFIVSQFKQHTLQDSVKLANIAAGIKRKKELGEVVYPDEILEELNNFKKGCIHKCRVNSL